jgi:hypothetical protein
MEDKLKNWIIEQVGNGATLSEFLICSVACRMAEEISKQIGAVTKFQASPGWLRNFCNRAKVRSFGRVGEALMIDQEVVDKFIDNFKKMIILKEFSPDQIFNVDETGLFWKKRPTKTYTTLEKAKILPGPKPDKSRITLLLGKYKDYN